MQTSHVNPSSSGAGLCSGAGRLPCAPAAGSRVERAFTLLELMVVIAIIAIVTALALPTIQKLAKPSGFAVANRQLMDDLALARSLALSSRAPVYVIFAPTNASVYVSTFYPTSLSNMVNGLLPGQYTAYALYSKRSVGDQPGPLGEHPRYLTDWKQLPENYFIPWYVLQDLYSGTFSYTNEFLFPSTESPVRPDMHCLVFLPDGSLASGRNAELSLAQGSVFNPRNPDGVTYRAVPPDLLETAPQINSGEITPGFTYQVGAQLGNYGVVNYGGTDYYPGQKFLGLTNVLTFTVTGKVFLKPYVGIEVNHVTGRGKMVRSELQ